MAVPLEVLYGLRDIDTLQPAWSSLIYRKELTGDPNAQFSGGGENTEPAQDKLWFITGFYARLTPQAAVVAETVRLRISASGAHVATLAGARSLPTDFIAGTSFIYSTPLDAILVGGVHRLVARFGFSAGNVANVAAWGFHGYELPRGNVQLR